MMQNRIGEEWGNYRLLHLIGLGGFAEVYLGQHVRLTSQRAALKILLTHLAEENVQRFQNEAETIVSLVHPHIVRVLDFDLKNGVPYLVMDYAPKGSLRLQHRRGEKVDLAAAVSYIQQVAEGLQYAHDRKIIHRDIKPDNMLIGARGEILLSDFGLATIAHGTNSQSAQSAIGTIPYMAPEQIQEHPRPASDQYALAVTLYEWLAGRPPFIGTFTEVAAKHVLVTPPPLRNWAPEVPPEVEQVITTALAKDPKARFGSVKAFATALTEASRDAIQEGNIETQPMQSPLSQTPVRFPSAPTPVPLATPQLPVSQDPPPTTNPSQLVTLPAQMWNVQQSLTSTPPVAPTPSMVPTPPVAPTPAAPIFSPPLNAPASPPPPATIPLPGPENKQKRRISRRGVVLGLIALGVITVGSSAAIIDHVLQSKPSITPSVPSPHPSPTPIGELVRTYSGHSAPIRSVAWSRDGKSIASGGEDKTVQVWDASTGNLLRNYQGHTEAVLTVAWSPNGQSIASGAQDDTAQVWNVSTGQLLSMNRNYIDHIHTVAWSPDGQYIASGSDDHSVQVWNVNTAVVTAQTLRFDNTLHTAPVEWVAWSPRDGKFLATSSDDGTIKILDSETGALVYNYTSSPDMPSALRWVLSALWSPDGKRIASTGRDGIVQVWDASTGSVVFAYNANAGWVERIAWSPNGEYIAAAYDNHVVEIIDAHKGTLHFTYQGHPSQVYAVAWSPDSKYIASAGADKSVQIWTAG